MTTTGNIRMAKLANNLVELDPVHILCIGIREVAAPVPHILHFELVNWSVRVHL